MVKIIIFLMKLFLLVLATIFFSSCHFKNGGLEGSGDVVTQARSLSKDFTKIDVSQGITVNVVQSDDTSVIVEADDNIIEHITTKVENGVLIIESDNSYSSEKTPTVTVKLPIISGLISSGNASISSDSVLITDKIEIDAESASSIDIKVEADLISIDAASGSTVSVSGKALKLTTSASSGSEIDADHLTTNEIYAEATSGSSTSVDPILKLEAHASSGSSISYKTTPKNLSKEEDSSASVSSM